VNKLITPKRITQQKIAVALTILRSMDGETNWEPVLPDDVPAFVKRSDIIRRIVDGEMVQLESQSPYWFRGEQQAIH